MMDATTLGSITTTGTASSVGVIGGSMGNGAGGVISGGGGGAGGSMAGVSVAYSAPGQTQRSTSVSGGSGSISGGAASGYREKAKLGHREVRDGVVHYKKVSTDELKKSIQFGIVHFINEQNRFNMDRDLLMQDFQVVETVVFPK